MEVRKIAIADALFERSPGQEGEIYAGNVVDQRHGGPVTIGYGRYAPNQSIDVTLEVDDTMVVLKGQVEVTSNGEVMTAGAGEIVYMPKGRSVKIRSQDEEVITAYVTYPHWQAPQG